MYRKTRVVTISWVMSAFVLFAFSVAAISYFTWTDFPEPGMGRGLVALDDHLYAIGGFNGNSMEVTGDIYYAPILPGGQAGEWQKTTGYLFEGRMFYNPSGCCTDGNRIYAVGGTGPQPNDWRQDSIFYMDPEPSGDIEIVLFDYAPYGVDYHACVAYGGYLYIIGGERFVTDHDEFDWISYAPIQFNGSLGQWATSQTLPMQGFGIKAAASPDGYLYIWGGRPGYNWSYPPNHEVYSAKIHGDGSLGSWQALPSLPMGIGDAVGVILPNNELIINLGGRTAQYTHTNKMYSNELAAGGQLLNPEWELSGLYFESVIYAGGATAVDPTGSVEALYILEGQYMGVAGIYSTRLGFLSYLVPTGALSWQWYR